MPEDRTPPTPPATERVRLRRGATLGHYDRDAVTAVLDAGLVAHVGVSTPDGPVVIPMAYGRDDARIYLHGATGNAALRAAAGQEVCVTVTVVDGLIFGRSAFHNSMQYRAVVIRGTAERLHGDDHERALRLVTDHVVANWDSARPATDGEIRQTMTIAVALTESSAKIRRGGPNDEPDDLDGPFWGGHVPVITTFGPPVDSPDLPAQVRRRPSIDALAGRTVHAPR